MELHVTKRKGREIVVLLDNDMRIVKPVYDYLKYQDQRDRAINTLIAYGNDLKAFWEFLSDYGYAFGEAALRLNWRCKNVTLLSYSYCITGTLKPTDT